MPRRGFRIAEGYLAVYADRSSADREVDGFIRDVNGRLHDQRGRYVAEGKQHGKAYGDGLADGEERSRFLPALRKLLNIGGRIAAVFGKILMPVAMLTKFGLMAGLAATAVAGLAAAVAKSIPSIVGLGNALVVSAGVLVAVPGVIATAVTALVTLKIGLSGVGDAFKAVMSGDVTKFNEALKQLSPNAQAFVKELKRLWPELDKVKKGIQDMLFANLDLQLQNLAKHTIPAISTGMRELAGSINLLVNKALDKLANKTTADTIAGTFDNMSQALAAMDRAIGPVVGALVSIVNVGSRVLKEMAGPLAEVLDDWGNRIQIMANQGTLKAMFEEGIDALKALGGLVKDVFGIISGFVKAAGSSEGLFGFFSKLNEQINSVAGQTALVALFAELKRISDALAPVLPPIGAALAEVAKGISAIAIAFAPYLPPLAAALGTALASLAPAIIALAPLLGIIANGLQPLAKIIGDLVIAYGLKR